MAYNSKFITFLLSWIAISFGVGGCSKIEQFDWGFKGSESPSPATESGEAKVYHEERVYYTGSDVLPLYKNPGSVLINRLPKYTKVFRDDLKRGYAHVRVDATGEEGWVENAKLIWRLPRQTIKSEPTQPTEKTAEEPTEKELVVKPREKELVKEEKPKPAEAVEPSTPSSTPDDPAVAPSIFNPY